LATDVCVGMFDLFWLIYLFFLNKLQQQCMPLKITIELY
jgi:hypothetical protein